jgi:hypothetical protein
MTDAATTEEAPLPTDDMLYELFRGYQVARWGTTDPEQIRQVAANFVTSKFQPAPALRHLAKAAFRVGWTAHDEIAEAVIQTRVDEIVEGEVGKLFIACQDETSPLWQQIGEVIEGVAPGISPYDRREAVAQVIHAIASVMDHWGII